MEFGRLASAALERRKHCTIIDVERVDMYDTVLPDMHACHEHQKVLMATYTAACMLLGRQNEKHTQSIWQGSST